MAYTIILGLSFATLMTFFVMPALYAIMTDLRRFFLRDEEARFRTVSDEGLLSAVVPSDD